MIVKGTNSQSREYDFECYDIFESPEELINDNYDYQVCNRLIWNPEDPLWYGAFAVPLFAIENDSDVKRELVAPVREILMLYKKSEKEFSKKSAEEIEQTAFAQTRDGHMTGRDFGGWAGLLSSRWQPR
jgi:hypothetical protein